MPCDGMMVSKSLQVYYIPRGCWTPKVELEMPPESESAVLMDRAELADDLEVRLGVASMVYVYEAVNSTVQVYDLFKVGDKEKRYK